jgi:hypothetical protein
MRNLIFKHAWLLLVVAGSLVCSGCHIISRDYHARMRTVPTDPVDIANAEYHRQTLPAAMGLDPSQVRIEPGESVTQVFVSGMPTREARLGVLSTVGTINAHNAFRPVAVQFE